MSLRYFFCNSDYLLIVNPRKQQADGWAENLYYIVDGYVVTDQAHYMIDGKAYSITADGKASTLEGLIEVEEKYYYYVGGIFKTEEFVELSQGTAYFGEDAGRYPLPVMYFFGLKPSSPSCL